MKPNQQRNGMVIPVAVSAIVVLALFGCGGGKSETAASVPSASTTAQAVALNNAKLCVFKDDDEATKCQSGQISLFLPSRWGNEQLPVIVAAQYCDFNFPVVHTNGAVSCVFYRGRTVFQREASKAPQGPASAATGG